MLLRVGQDEKIEHSPIILPGGKAHNLSVRIFPERGITSFIDYWRAESPGEIDDMGTGEGLISYKVENARQINFTTIHMARKIHDSILPLMKN
jgi:hypothetical protein